MRTSNMSSTIIAQMHDTREFSKRKENKNGNGMELWRTLSSIDFHGENPGTNRKQETGCQPNCFVS